MKERERELNWNIDNGQINSDSNQMEDDSDQKQIEIERDPSK